MLQLWVDGTDETTGGQLATVVECKGAGHVCVGVLEGGRVALGVLGIFLVLFLTFLIVVGLLLHAGLGLELRLFDLIVDSGLCLASGLFLPMLAEHSVD
jgi:hypothetical protein